MTVRIFWVLYIFRKSSKFGDMKHLMFEWLTVVLLWGTTRVPYSIPLKI